MHARAPDRASPVHRSRPAFWPGPTKPRRRPCLFEEGHRSICRDRTVVGSPRLSSGLQCGFDRADLRLLEFASAMSFRRGSVNSPSTFCRIWRSISSSPVATRLASERVGEGGRLASTICGFGDAEFAIGSLQATVVQQRDLHRGFDGELIFQSPCTRALVAAASSPLRILTMSLLSSTPASDLDEIHATVGGKVGAAAERHRRHDRGQSPKAPPARSSSGRVFVCWHSRALIHPQGSTVHVLHPPTATVRELRHRPSSQGAPAALPAGCRAARRDC